MIRKPSPFEIEEDDGDPPEEESPPITELDIKIIAVALHDQGRGHVIPDMIEAMTGVRPPDDAYTPKRMQIRDPAWRQARKKLERKKYRARRRSRAAPEEKAKEIGRLENWKAANPKKMEAAEARRLEDKKAARKARQLVAVDLEGFDTGRYFTDDRPDYAREHHELLAHEHTEEKIGASHRRALDHTDDPPIPFAGWTEHDHDWYLAQHDITPADPLPTPKNRKAGAPPIYIEHRPFMFGAGNDPDRYILTTGDGVKKVPLSGDLLLNTIADLPKRFDNAIYLTYAFNYDVAQILRCLDADTAGQLQAGEVVTKKIDDDGAPSQEVIEQAVFFWKEFAFSYRRGKMFRVGRLNDPAKPYKYKEIIDAEIRQAYIDAGREPVMREIDYKDKPVTLNDTFGFFQMSFIDAYDGSGIAFTLEEAKIIVEGKRKRQIMASLPMDEVKLYQEMELRILCRMMKKLLETTNSLGLDLPHLQGAGAISMAVANKHRSRDFYPTIKAKNWSVEQEWAHYAFAGGRIEMVMQGRHTGGIENNEYGPPRPLFGYDITSAYPSIQYQLPAMALPIEWELNKDGSPGRVKRRIGGRWIWREGAELTEDIIRMMSIYSMIEVDFTFPEKCFDPKINKLRDAPWYPLFYRMKDGSILFPAAGRGRYYRDELLSAFEWVRRMRPDMNETQHARMIKLRGAYEYVYPTVDDLSADQLKAIKKNCPSARIGEDGLVYPFHYIKEYYDERAKYPKTDIRNDILKKGICGAWGKTAQSVGGKDGRPPASASPWYAGIVTAGTRAKCVIAALNAPWNIIHFATDGIQSNAPLNIESEKKTLGAWEMDTFTRGVYIKPGIYAFADDFVRPEKYDEGNPLEMLVADHVFKGKSRGVSLRSILGEDDDAEAKRNIQEEWFDYLDKLAFDCYSNSRPNAAAPHKKLMTFGAAASCADRWPMCGNWVETAGLFDMRKAGVKRLPCFDMDRAHDLVITKVAPNMTPRVLSKRHDTEWMDVEQVRASAEIQALVNDSHDNQNLALANDWHDFGWDVGDD